jgi:hypothetical protein
MGGVQHVERQACFGKLVRLLYLWPPGTARRHAFEEAEATLERAQAGTIRWNPIFRRLVTSWGANNLQDANGKVSDVLTLVRDLRVQRSAPDASALNVSNILASPYGAELHALEVHDLPLSLVQLAAGRACGRLSSLDLYEAVDENADWVALQSWTSLDTLQCITIRGGVPRVLPPSFWDLLECMPKLHALCFVQHACSSVVRALLLRPLLAQRIDQLQLQQCNLAERDLACLVENTNLRSLISLDLRRNRVSEAAILELTRAPQFRRTNILVDAA